jgi:transposase InsO family protein
MDALYIRGMLNHPDVQPNATINRWIAAILLFDFKLVHIPAEKHRGPDGLSRREPADGEDEHEDDPEEWIDRTLALGVWVVSWLGAALTNDSTAAWTLKAHDNSPPRRSARLRAKDRSAHLGSIDTDNNSQHSDSLEHSADNLPSLANGADLCERGNSSPEHPADNLPSFAVDAAPSAHINGSPERSNDALPVDIDTANRDSAPTANDDDDASCEPPFPPNAKAAKAEDELLLVHEYLRCPRPPPHLHGDALTSFLRRVARFTLASDRLWRIQGDGRHQLYVVPPLRLSIVRNAHDGLGHKGFYSTRRTIADRFWWPSLDSDVKWYVKTCHQCQLRQTTQARLPPTVDSPAPLFRKVYIDTMFMPHASGFRYIVQARCSLTAWPEWRALRVETGRTLGSFIFEDILCRWGGVGEIVTDNGTAYVAALDWLSRRYGIRHIRISAYNSRANGIVERQHRSIRDSLVKACNGDTSRWPTVAPFVFWADRATTRKATGLSPFYMAHGVEPILPFDITLATFLVPNLVKPLTTDELIATRARQLEKRQDDLTAIHGLILKSRFASARQFERHFEHTIHDFDFKPGALVLVRNPGAEFDKVKPRYCGPMLVVRRTRNGAYRLAELDGAVSRLRYAAFRLIPYFARSLSFIPVTRVVDRDDLASVIADDNSPAQEVQHMAVMKLTGDGQI